MHTFVPEFLKLGKPHSYIRPLERGNSYKSGTCLWQSKHFKTAYYLPSLQKSFAGITDGKAPASRIRDGVGGTLRGRGPRG